MALLMPVAIGLLFACGTYLVLQRSILRLIIGLGLMSHGVNLLLFTMGELRKPSVFSKDSISSIPVIEKAPNISQIETMADPLVQALILTAIVISFGVTAFILVVGYRAQRKFGTDDLDILRRLRG